MALKARNLRIRGVDGQGEGYGVGSQFCQVQRLGSVKRKGSRLPGEGAKRGCLTEEFVTGLRLSGQMDSEHGGRQGRLGRATRGSDLMMFKNILQLWCLGNKCIDYILVSHM